MAEAIAAKGLARPRRDGHGRRRFGKDGLVEHRHLHVHSFDRRRTIAQYPNERKRLIRRSTPLARGSPGNCGGNTQLALTRPWALLSESAHDYLPTSAEGGEERLERRAAAGLRMGLAVGRIAVRVAPTSDRGALDPAVAAELLRLSRVEAVAAVLRRGRVGGCGRRTAGSDCERRRTTAVLRPIMETPFP